MDDSRIRQLTEEVLAQLAGPKDPVASDLEARIAALEAEVRGLRAALGRPGEPGAPAPAAPVSVTTVVAIQGHAHPALQVLGVAGGSERCVLEPDKPCVQSGQCRHLGH